MAKMSRAERVARTKDRLDRSEKRIAKFREAYARLGIPVSQETVVRMAMIEPVDLTVRVTRDPEEDPA